MRNLFRQSFSKKDDQSGLASIVVVGVLIVLLTIISLGFAKIMDRSVNNSLNNQLGSAATYAAQSGLNDSIAYLKANPSYAGNANCNDLFQAGAGLENKNNLSGVDGNTKYTCVIINKTPTDLAFQRIPAYQSQIVKLTTLQLNGTPSPPDTVDAFMFSWQSTNPDFRNFVDTTDPLTLTPETQWGSDKNAPVLRVTLYPVSDTTNQADQQSAKTFFFYPSKGAPGSNTTVVDSQTTADGDLLRVTCSTNHAVQPAASDFTGSGDYDCNVVIDRLKDGPDSNKYYYARITPIYNQADIKVKANEAGNKVLKFAGTQASIDVTGKSSTATKRLQARVGLSSTDCNATDNCAPEAAIRSAKRICKRLDVGTSDVTIPVFNYCDIPQQPKIPTCSIATAGPYVIGKSITFNAGAGYGAGTYSWKGGDNPSTGNGNSFTTTYSTTGHKTVIVTSKDPNSNNAPSANCDFDVYVTPTVTLCINALSPCTKTITLANGGSANLFWTSTNANTCTASNAWSGSRPLSGGPQSTGGLAGPATKTYTLTCFGGGGTQALDSVDIVINGSSSPPVDECGIGTGSGGGPERSEACIRAFDFLGWASANNATFGYHGSHCYDGHTINGTNVTWDASPSDNDQYRTITIGFNNNGGTATFVCAGNNTKSASVSVPPGPVIPACPSPPGSGPCPPPAVCEDPSALNYKGPLPCVYPVGRYILFYDCHGFPPSTYAHWSDGVHEKLGACGE